MALQHFTQAIVLVPAFEDKVKALVSVCECRAKQSQRADLFFSKAINCEKSAPQDALALYMISAGLCSNSQANNKIWDLTQRLIATDLGQVSVAAATLQYEIYFEYQL